MSTLSDRIAAFLASEPIAVVGASRDPGKYGHIVLRALLESGRRAIPVNPKEAEILGEPAVPTVADLPVEVTALSVITPPAVTAGVIAAAIPRGTIARIWLQPGSEDDAAIEAAREAGIDVIADGACILVALSRERVTGA